MTDLFVYDGHPFRLQSQDREGVEKKLQQKLDKVLDSLRSKVPDYLLLRTVIDYDKRSKNFHGIDNLLTDCVVTGHDRSNHTNLDKVIDPYGEIAKAGYQSEDVMWATPVLRDKQFTPYTWSGAANGINIGILIIDGRAYHELEYSVYGQKDESLRKKSLLGIALFDMNVTKEGLPRPDLHLTLTPENIIPVTKKILEAGYFSE